MKLTQLLSISLRGILMASVLSAGATFVECSSPSPTSLSPKNFTAAIDSSSLIGGEGVVVLTNTSGNSRQPHFSKIVLLPGRGMNMFQLSGFIPGRGDVDVLMAEPLTDVAQMFAETDPYGNLSFKYGGAFLVPFANRIRGKLSSDHKTLLAKVADQSIELPANWMGQKPGAEPHAMHGLILNSTVSVTDLIQTDQAAEVQGHLAAGDFSGHWPSKTNVSFHVILEDNLVRVKIETKNVGTEKLPVGIGWHPYFKFPSGHRGQARLKIPATDRALVNNYDDVFPTGILQAVAGTPYDFTKGRALGTLFLDDCFMNVVRQGSLPVIAEIVDPAADYGLRIRVISPLIKAFQVYAPIDKSFAAFEPQFNIGDPYGKEWKGSVDNGMVLLAPGESATYEVELELFNPNAQDAKIKL